MTDMFKALFGVPSDVQEQLKEVKQGNNKISQLISQVEARCHDAAKDASGADHGRR